ncbi:MAG: 30S ribosomal protein S6 [Patescibacteria group bacterium]
MKIPSNTRVQSYELTYLTGIGLTSDEQKAVAEKLAKAIKKFKGTIKNTEDWGKKVLAYTIKKEGKKYDEAIYTHLVLEIPATKVQDLEKEVYLLPEIIRHLLVIADDSESATAESDEAKAE